ncbi:MFS transporter [Ramlibacter sp.]|uniref:MFS transporter n=1 Tax=Ramlibacter sp. TaxID=1917967 RepID=UPI0017B682F5|nr:MFS transporter [Ramlibacter sp.]MBA2675125.1 MFS transporter [Ramlibacter sp.]
MPVLTRLLLARALRGFGDGFVSLLLPVYLLHLGLRPLEVGFVATATLAGSGLLTLGVGLRGQRLQRRTVLLAASALMAFTGFALAAVHGFWPLMLVALVGTLNPSGGDISVFMPMEHATLAEDTPPAKRTAVFARYSLAGTLAAAVGALAAGLQPLAVQATGLDEGTTLAASFALYGLLGIAVAFVYRGLPRHQHTASPAPTASALGPSRKRIYVLAGLFSIDAFGSGFFVQSLLALWLFQRFGMSVEAAGSLFFWTGVLTAFSYLAAVRLAGCIGLVQTMVYTHLPSSLCLIVIPFCDNLSVVVALLLARSALSQMDVPTRSSYVMAIVQPEERAAAASVTSVPRSFASAVSPALAGWMLTASSFGWPLVVGGVLKVVYDLMLLVMFEKVKPPEEG